MEQEVILYTILGMAVVSFVPRALPAQLLSSKTLPEWVIRWLGYVPTAVLSAMLVPALLVHEGKLDVSENNIFFWAAIPTFALVLKTRSFFGAVALGMGLVAAGRYYLG
ncbi:MAG: AzlD domain-containing protein [Desulfovibrio sp.]